MTTEELAVVDLDFHLCTMNGEYLKVDAQPFDFGGEQMRIVATGDGLGFMAGNAGLFVHAKHIPTLLSVIEKAWDRAGGDDDSSS